MKIAIDTRTLQEGKITGVEIYSKNLIRALIEIDDINEYLLFYNSYRMGPPSWELPAKKNFTWVSFRFPNRLLNLSLLLLRYPKIDKLLGGVDIFFSPRYLFTALSSRCKLVVVMHDLSFVHFPQFFSKKHRLWHSILSDRSACRKACAVIAVSAATRRDVISTFKIDEQKTHVVLPGLDHKAYSPKSDVSQEILVRKQFGLFQPFILYLGTIEPRKNILGILAAFEILKRRRARPLELVLAGGLGWLYKKILRKIRASAFRGSIKLLGQVSENSKATLYRMAEVMVFPSFFEGFGFPPLEAMACGTPVVAAHNSSLHEVLGSAALYVNPYDAEQIAAGLENFLSDPHIRTLYTARGIGRAKEFDWQKTARGVLEVLESVSYKQQ